MNYHPNAKTTIALRKAIRECHLPVGKVVEKFNMNTIVSVPQSQDKF